MENNLQIIKRLFELAKIGDIPNKEFPFPNSYKEEHLYLPNVLDYALTSLEREFSDKFRDAISDYKLTKKESKKKYGWFHYPERLIYIRMKINQIMYALYGEMGVREIKFNNQLGAAAYKDLIDHIDPTALLTPKQKKEHLARCGIHADKIAREIENEIKKGNV